MSNRYDNRWRDQRRNDLRGIIQLGKAHGRCIDCHQQYPAYLLEYDHRDPREKKFNISDAPTLVVSIQGLLTEIAKCDVVCSHCHTTRHYEQRNPGTRPVR